jgi:integrase
VDDVRSFRESLRRDGGAPQTVNQLIRKNLSIPFQSAWKLGIISMNPVQGVESLLEETGDRDVFSPEDIARLCAHATPDWQGAILIAYYTGARLQDVCNLTWGNVDVATGLISFVPKKTRRKRKTIQSAMDPALQDWLISRSQPENPDTFVFQTLAGKSEGGKSGLSQQFKKIMRQVGIRGRVIQTRSGVGRSIETLSFHSLRHSFNSALANAGVEQELRQKLTGHSSAQMNAIYTHHEIDTLRQAVSKMPKVLVPSVDAHNQASFISNPAWKSARSRT